MRLQQLLPFAAAASAIVIPDEALMKQISLESDSRDIFDKYASSAQGLAGDAKCRFSNVVEATHDFFDNAVHSVKETFDSATSELSSTIQDEFLASDHDDHGHHPHKPHKGHPHHRLNLTVYQLISESKYTTKLAALINEFDDVVTLLNSTEANFTVFAPTDSAFEKIPDHGHKPSKDVLLKVLSYHVVPGLFPAGRVLASHTLPTLLEGDELSSDPKTTPQRLNIKLGWTGLYIDGFSKVVYPNVFGTNGAVHAVDHILIPPPHIATIVKYSPTAFSTLTLALQAAELTPGPHLGFTFFAPPNGAWKKLGFRVNAFLFSKYGKKYLKAILQYHSVANQTLYSDAFYGVGEGEGVETFPKGVYHVSFDTRFRRFGLLLMMV